MKLTTKELQALEAAWESSNGNGHDFGFVDEMGFTGKHLSGLCSALVEKGLLFLWEPEKINGSWEQQTELHRDLHTDTWEQALAAVKAMAGNKTEYKSRHDP